MDEYVCNVGPKMQCFCGNCNKLVGDHARKKREEDVTRQARRTGDSKSNPLIWMDDNNSSKFSSVLLSPILCGLVCFFWYSG